MTRLRSEVESVPDRDRQAYSQALLRGLQGDSRMPNILPEMAIAFGMQNGNSFLETNKWRWAGDDRIVNPDKLSTAASREANPVYQELYREMFNKYRGIKAENADNGNVLFDKYAMKYFIPGQVVPESQLRREQAVDSVRSENRRQFGALASNPKTF